ncbi:MAG: hypothetical protein ABJO01_04050 [Parasphingorhabdus sp.]|uniref:hypothetical protein n=1 Tax=Parasphingorhabdus sp. TaxID=2709688 RepID=UPI00329762ED
MSLFFETMIGSFPEAISVPDPLITYFRWIGEQRLDHNFGGDGYAYADIGPDKENGCLALGPVDSEYAKAWTHSDDPSVYDRLAAFCQTGGDGSYVALWLDNDGGTRIVHLGSGSGSTMLGVLVNDPVDLLRLLAIGYDELCWPENHGKTPKEIWAEDNDEEEFEPAPNPPVLLQKWVSQTFDVNIPKTASEIVSDVPDMGDDKSDDPFWQWIMSLEPKE